MRQKQRDRIAWILTAVLVPLLIYLLATNIGRTRKKAPPPPSPVTVALMDRAPSPSLPSPPPQPQPAPAVDPKILAEQQRIAALLPRKNPFNPSQTVGSDISPAATGTPHAEETGSKIKPPVTAETGIKLTAIVSYPPGGARMAMINGRLLGEGDRIADWTIIKVTDREVILKDGARQMVLRLK